jgi:hypothetical protein
VPWAGEYIFYAPGEPARAAAIALANVAEHEDLPEEPNAEGIGYGARRLIENRVKYTDEELKNQQTIENGEIPF